jgi:exodeoxyribonuclease V alpha subunit
MNKIRCVVERITYQNPENGYSVLKCRVKDYRDLIPVVGNLRKGLSRNTEWTRLLS